MIPVRLSEVWSGLEESTIRELWDDKQTYERRRPYRVRTENRYCRRFVFFVGPSRVEIIPFSLSLKANMCVQYFYIFFLLVLNLRMPNIVPDIILCKALRWIFDMLWLIYL